MRDWVRLLTELAATQDGVFSVEQAAEVGVDRRRLRRAEEAGLLVRLHPRVHSFAGSAPTQRSGIRAATLQVAGSRASHESALTLHHVPSMPFEVAVSVGFGAAHQHGGIRVHRYRRLPDEHCLSIGGIPTTTLERAVVDVASVFHRARLEYLVDQLTITSRRTSVGAIGRALRQVDRRGRVRIGTLGRILDARRPSEPAPRSRLERRVDELLATAPLPRPVHEHPLPSQSELAGFVDRAWVEAMLILEIDGRTWHAREASMAKDRARDRAAASAGWQTIRVLDEEVADCPTQVVDDVVAAYTMRVTQLARIA
jgi:hypothetical protein